MAAQRELARTDPGFISAFTVVLICMGITVVATFGEFAVGVLGPAFEADLGADPSQLGILMALMFAASSLAAMPMGVLADRVDPRKLLFAQVTLAALAFGAFALVASPEHLFIVVVIVGGIMSLNSPMTNRMVIDFVPFRHRSSAIAWKSVGLQVSALLVGLTFGLTEPFAHWRATVVATMAVMLCFAVVAHLRFRRAIPLRVPGAHLEPETVTTDTGSVRVVAVEVEGRIANPIVWWLIPYSLLTLGSFSAVAAYMVFFATTDVGVSPGAAANASGIAAGVSIVARFLWVRWLTERNEVLVLGLAGLASALAVLLLAVSPVFGPVGFWAAAMVVGMTIFASTPVQQVVLMRNTNPRYIGRVSSIVGASISASLAGMPFLMSQVIGGLGLQPTWYIVVVITLLGAATMALYALIHRRSAR